MGCAGGKFAKKSGSVHPDTGSSPGPEEVAEAPKLGETKNASDEIRPDAPEVVGPVPPEAPEVVRPTAPEAPQVVSPDPPSLTSEPALMPDPQSLEKPPSIPELEDVTPAVKGDSPGVAPQKNAWGRLMTGFLMAKLDSILQESLAVLSKAESNLFAHHIHHEYSEGHFQVHQKFLSSLESRLEEYLGGSLGISVDDLAEILQHEASDNVDAKIILDRLLQHTELHEFSTIMRQRCWGSVKEVRLFWDIQNIGGEVMEGESSRMIRTLVTFLKDNYMLSGNVDMWAVAPLHYYADRQTMVRDLNDFGITVVHCSDKAEAADHLIKSRIEKDLTAMQKSGTPPAETAFILITSDKDFTDVLRKLYFNGHKTVVVHNVEMKGTKKSEHFEKLTLFSTECFAFSDIVTWDLVHEQDAWQKVMGWASSRVQPGVRIKTPRQEVASGGGRLWHCTFEVDFGKGQRAFLSEGWHRERYESGAEAAKAALTRLQALFGDRAEERVIKQADLKAALKR